MRQDGQHDEAQTRLDVSRVRFESERTDSGYRHITIKVIIPAPEPTARA